MIQFIVAVIATTACITNAQKLEIKTTFKPDGCDSARKTTRGDHLGMHYTGSIDESSKTGTKGKIFDSSIPRNSPFGFTLGKGQVIRGWEEGLLDMCEGEKRVLILPPEYGYGASGAGKDIPGGATLKFEVECLTIGDAPPVKPQPNIFKEIDADKDMKISKEEIVTWFKETRGVSDLPDGLWENEDKDKDGFITYAEFSGPKGEDEL
mmetsp:Transcript_36472/g.37145  ORF Transcript_36472/g.37145 Transcript_36472/m.37145 type:complete len:208 (-) Transcript_36472:22-645(-)|eukprot:CAMPEP_0182424064 /NCGR_PEP_ID=MMETSP1167-20130531/10206_1 /TAXON_ID=2988 /ORGANISM="Mallomonas Sp, Strain CCMP3275" /LENGTH=207 /DNA_ID=CAMNT_0024603585 /DNA_START=97 /DNA_END=720 /DNA_ORIENTATION=-